MTVATALAQERPFPFLLGTQTIALTMAPFDALVVINPQNDFFPGGAMPIPGSQNILKPIRGLVDLAKENGVEVLVSARSYNIEEADHCISDTYGYEMKREIGVINFYDIYHQNEVGNRSCLDSRNNQGQYLFERLYLDGKIGTTLVVGMPMEECVKVSVLEAINFDLNVLVAIDACAGFDNHEAEKAIFEMKKAGAIITTSAKILRGRV